MNNPLYAVWLQQCIGYSCQKIKEMLDFFGSAEEIYAASAFMRRQSGFFTPNQLKRFSSYTLDDARVIVDKCKRLNYTILSIEDEDYPSRLYEITNPPVVLYISGKMPDVDNTLTIGVVGTRTATSEGIRNSFTFGRDLSMCGVIVVSGGALGIDCASHRGVLQNNGVTVCVLGCGINYNYLSENAQMRRLITNKGAVISEYPPDFPPSSYSFPQRNRIISGLSNGVLVIEAGVRSGSLITARLALEQNRDVFSVPGSLANARAQGTNALLKQGAITVTSYRDIVEEYAQRYKLTIEHESVIATENEVSDIPVAGRRTAVKPANTPKPDKAVSLNIDFNNRQNNKQTQVTPKCPDGVSDEARLVFDALGDKPRCVDEIADKLKIPPQAVMASLTELEIFGAAQAVSGGRYIRN
ncbi:MULTISPECIES: DNA-processing protein DprA [unclassified Ruminococcus]|uniref:DNA-processing protein DprA n=1 Tax=unclassified Ruminococcus TaxID=2608920 RepID=UPI0021086929|nr:MULTISPECIES: DNA-processing protein DprA [unclassified Ruminococcus]MCQ4021628.1 DNA-protecting protein DprA [Ruminococcus sp. zg-924]MCQ4114073.1 DNA-protecting protein DprA [Ruminococcus sp. zg-921]